MSAGASCKRVRARLIALCDGALSPLEEARDRGHLEVCEDCACALAEHERLLSAVRAASAEHAAELEPIHAAILARLPAPEGRRALRRRVPPSLSLAGAAAALLLLLGLAFGLPAAPRAPTTQLETFLERVPAWPQILRGLESLSQSHS